MKLVYSYEDSTTGAVDKRKFQNLRSDFFFQETEERFVTEFRSVASQIELQSL